MKLFQNITFKKFNLLATVANSNFLIFVSHYVMFKHTVVNKKGLLIKLSIKDVTPSYLRMRPSLVHTQNSLIPIDIGTI